MRTHSLSATPFTEGQKAAKAKPDCVNPYASGSVEHRNYELGRDFGLKHFRFGDGRRTFEPRG